MFPEFKWIGFKEYGSFCSFPYISCEQGSFGLLNRKLIQTLFGVTRKALLSKSAKSPLNFRPFLTWPRYLDLCSQCTTPAEGFQTTLSPILSLGLFSLGLSTLGLFSWRPLFRVRSSTNAFGRLVIEARNWSRTFRWGHAFGSRQPPWRRRPPPRSRPKQASAGLGFSPPSTSSWPEKKIASIFKTELVLCDDRIGRKLLRTWPCSTWERGPLTTNQTSD